MSLVGLDPPRVLKLADAMGDAANDAYLWGQLVGHEAQRCWLETKTPEALDELASDLVELGRILRARAWYADDFRPQFDRLIIGLNSLAAKYVPLAYKKSGVLSLFGTADAANPSERVEIFRGELSADLRDLQKAGLTIDGSVAHVYLIEYRRDGTVKVTVVDEAALGLSVGAHTKTAAGFNINGILPSAKLSVEARMQALAGIGTSYVVPRDQLALFVQHDLLLAATGGNTERLTHAVGDAINSLPDRVTIGPFGAGTSVGDDAGRLIASIGDMLDRGVGTVFRKGAGAVDTLASVFTSDGLKQLAAAMAYRPPKPVSSFVQAGAARGASAAAMASARRTFGLNGATAASAIVGLSTMGTVRALYLNLSASASAEAALGIFDENFDSQAQVQVALVEDAADGSVFADLTLSAVRNADAVRRVVRIDLRDPNVKAVFERVLEALLGGSRITSSVRDAIGSLGRLALRLSRDTMSFESSTTFDATIGKTGFDIERTEIKRK